MTSSRLKNTMEKNQRIELVKDVFTLIHPHLLAETSEKEERDHEERKRRVQTWLSDIVQAISREENPWNTHKKGRGELMHLLPQFLRLLRECILSHQWTQVLSMLKSIAHIPYGADWLTWKTSLAALYTEPESNSSLIKDLFKCSFLLRECNADDIALEFVQYLISQDLTEDASKVLKAARKAKHGTKGEYQRGLNEHTLNLMDGYQGLVLYVDWKAALSRQQHPAHNTPSQSFGSQTAYPEVTEDAIKNLAKQASLGLDSVIKEPGIWDIFLTKSIEIHEFYGDYDKAKALLCMYREKNPDNPNAHRFMYEYLTRNHAHYDEGYVHEESVRCLKSLAKLDPANPLMLTLWQKLTDDGRHNRALTYVFDLQDFEIWQEKQEGWHCLATSLCRGFSKERSEEEKTAFLSAVRNCWSTRSDWWPEYQFVRKVVANADRPSPSDHLHISRAVVAAVLLGQDCRCTAETRKVLSPSSCQHLDDALSDIDWDSIRELTEDNISPLTHSIVKSPSEQGRRTRARRSKKEDDSFTDTDNLRPDFAQTTGSPVTGDDHSAESVQKSPSSLSDLAPAETRPSSEVVNLNLLDLLSYSFVSVDPSSCEDLTSVNTNWDDIQLSDTGEQSRHKRARRRTKQGKGEKSSKKSVYVSDVFSTVPLLETGENAAKSSSQRTKRKWKAEEEDLEWLPPKNWKAKN